jgi:hypothetical protein
MSLDIGHNSLHSHAAQCDRSSVCVLVALASQLGYVNGTWSPLVSMNNDRFTVLQRLSRTVAFSLLVMNRTILCRNPREPLLPCVVANGIASPSQSHFSIGSINGAFNDRFIRRDLP